MSQEFVDDVDAPALTVDCPYDPNNMPEAYIGKYYPISGATGFDKITGNSRIDVSVDYNYTSGYPVNVPVENNKFFVERQGIYRIKYTAIDGFNNSVSKYYYVHAGKDIAELSISVTDKHENVDLGDMFAYSDPLINGGSGDKNVRVILSSGDQSFDITEDRSMYIKELGNWSVKYIVSDYAGATVEYSYLLNIRVTNRKYIYDTPVFSNFLIGDMPFVLPELYCYEYSTGVSQKELCNVYVNYNGSSHSYSSGTQINLSVNKNKDEMTFVYYKDNNQLDPIIRPVLKLGNASSLLDVKSYFFGAEDNISSDSQGIKLKGNKDNDSISFTYINNLLKNNVSLQIGNIYESYQALSNFKKIVLTLTDKESNSLSINMSFSTAGIELSSNGNSTSIPFSFNISSNIYFDLEYDGALSRMIFTTNKGAKYYLNIFNYDSGEAFNGFKSYELTLDMTISGVSANNGIRINKLCGVSLNKTTDDVNPFIAGETVKNITASSGTAFTLSQAFTSDLFAPFTKGKVSVLSPSGTMVRTTDDVLLNSVTCDRDYTFVLTEFGEYSVIYVVEETSWVWNKNYSVTYKLNAIDDTAPMIKLANEFADTYHVGDIVYIPGIIVLDNKDSTNQINVEVHVFTPGDIEFAVSINGGFRVNEVGRYRIYITAKDSAGNVGALTRSINVIA